MRKNNINLLGLGGFALLLIGVGGCGSGKGSSSADNPPAGEDKIEYVAPPLIESLNLVEDLNFTSDNEEQRLFLVDWSSLNTAHCLLFVNGIPRPVETIQLGYQLLINEEPELLLQCVGLDGSTVSEAVTLE